MFHRKYGHAHSAGAGFVLALALMQHALLFGVLVFAAGLIAGRAWSFWSDMARAVRDRLLNAHAKREPIETRPVPVYSVPRKRPLDGTPFDGLD